MFDSHGEQHVLQCCFLPTPTDPTNRSQLNLYLIEQEGGGGVRGRECQEPSLRMANRPVNTVTCGGDSNSERRSTTALGTTRDSCMHCCCYCNRGYRGLRISRAASAVATAANLPTTEFATIRTPLPQEPQSPPRKKRQERNVNRRRAGRGVVLFGQTCLWDPWGFSTEKLPNKAYVPFGFTFLFDVEPVKVGHGSFRRVKRTFHSKT